MAKLSKQVEALRRELRQELASLRARLETAEALTFTLRQAAVRLNRSERTVRRMVAAGLIATVELRGTPMVPASELKRLSTPVMSASSAVVERVAKARALLTSRPRARRSAAAVEAARVRSKYSKQRERHPQD